MKTKSNKFLEGLLESVKNNPERKQVIETWLQSFCVNKKDFVFDSIIKDKGNKGKEMENIELKEVNELLGLKAEDFKVNNYYLNGRLIAGINKPIASKTAMYEIQAVKKGKNPIPLDNFVSISWYVLKRSEMVKRKEYTQKKRSGKKEVVVTTAESNFPKIGTFVYNTEKITFQIQNIFTKNIVDEKIYVSFRNKSNVTFIEELESFNENYKEKQKVRKYAYWYKEANKIKYTTAYDEYFLDDSQFQESYPEAVVFNKIDNLFIDVLDY